MALRSDPTARFWGHVDKTGECWVWTSKLLSGGYGHFFVSRESGTRLAHRYAYEVEVGVIPEGFELHHLCGTAACVRPAHLQAMSHAEHAALHPHASPGALNGAARANLAKEACKYGHPFTPENIYWVPKQTSRSGRPWRRCRICIKARSAQPKITRQLIAAGRN